MAVIRLEEKITFNKTAIIRLLQNDFVSLHLTLCLPSSFSTSSLNTITPPSLFQTLLFVICLLMHISNFKRFMAVHVVSQVSAGSSSGTSC